MAGVHKTNISRLSRSGAVPGRRKGRAPIGKHDPALQELSNLLQRISNTKPKFLAPSVLRIAKRHKQDPVSLARAANLGDPLINAVSRQATFKAKRTLH